MFDCIWRLVSVANRRPSQSAKSRRLRFRPKLEVLEGRIAPAVLVVNTTADDGSAGSLRQVIANAPAGSTITFDPNVFPQEAGTTITLDPSRGPIPITANNLTIDGGSRTTVSISGGGNSRIFNILGGNLTETIQNVFLENGTASAKDPNGGDGGAILDTSQAPLTLFNVLFDNNNADWNGGAVYTQLGSNNILKVTNCWFQNNSALNANNPPTVQSSGVGGAIDAGGYQPGGDYVDNNLTISDSNFQYNNAAGGGGAVYLDNEDGGAQLNVSNSGFQDNSTLLSGGGILTFGLTTIANSTFQNNTAAYSGGGLFVGQPVLLTVTYSTFQGNTAKTYYGGAAECMSDATFLGDLFYNNKATGANGAGGALAIFNQSTVVGYDTIDLFNDTFYNNFADGYGGGLYLYASSGANDKNIINLTSLTIYQNSASTQGGGIYVDPNSIYGGNNTPPQLTNNIIAGNDIENAPADGPDIYGQIFTNSYNLVGIGDGATVTNNGGKWYLGDQVGTSAAPKDPSLDPNGLQNNGGPTLTIKPVLGSPALNVGNPTLVGKIDGTQLDQRGYKRQIMGLQLGVTIGAYDAAAKVAQAAQSSTTVVSSLNPALPGQAVTFTASVSGDGNGTPTGSITFYDGTNMLGNASVDDNGEATLSTTLLALGDHTITAVYSGDDTFAGSSASLSQTVASQTITTTTSLSSDNYEPLPGQTVTFTASLSTDGQGTPTGTVTFLDGTAVLGTTTLDGSGNAVLSTATLPLGADAITAVYNGNTTFAPSSAQMTQTVAQGLTSLVLSSSDYAVNPGENVTFTANVASDGLGTPTGSVTFLDGTTTLGTSSLDANGNASLSTSSLSAGNHDITAIYNGSSTFVSSSGSITQTIIQYPSSGVSSSTSLSSSPNASLPDQSVTFTATVSGYSGTPTGSVTFYNGASVLGSESLDGNGVASITTSSLGLGNYNITAIYSGDGTYIGSAASMNQYVSLDTSSVSLATSVTGQEATLTATVSGSSVTPTGSVTFYDGSSVLGTATLDGNGNASLTTTLALGDHLLFAVYSGDSTYAASDSYSQSQSISAVASTISVSSSSSPSLVRQSVTLTASVSGGYGTATGSVTFLDGTTVLGSVTLDGNGMASLTTSALGLGSHDIIAIYSGDSVYASSAASLSQAVVQADSTTSLSSSANPSPLGQSVTFTATVAASDPNDGTPTGTVAFYDGTTFLGTGTLTLVDGQLQATFTTSALGLGTHDIIAIYSGDDTFADSASSLEQTISS